MGLRERKEELRLFGELDSAAEVTSGSCEVIGMLVDGVDVGQEAEIGMKRDFAKNVGMEVELIQNERVEVRNDVVVHFICVNHIACTFMTRSTLRFEPTRLHFAKIHARHDVPLGPIPS